MYKTSALYPGHPIGIHALLPGTLGLIIREEAKGKAGLLSCSHVLASSGHASNLKVKFFSEASGSLTRGQSIAYVGASTLSRQCDAAIAWLNPGLKASNKVLGTDITLTGVRKPKVGDILAKVGAETGFTRGRVTEIGYKKVHYGNEIKKIYSMVLEPLTVNGKMQLLAEPGDSGAVWFDEENGLAVGLHFAGEHVARYGPIHAKACLMTHVLEELGVELYLDN